MISDQYFLNYLFKNGKKSPFFFYNRYDKQNIKNNCKIYYDNNRNRNYIIKKSELEANK